MAALMAPLQNMLILRPKAKFFGVFLYLTYFHIDFIKPFPY